MTFEMIIFLENNFRFCYTGVWGTWLLICFEEFCFPSMNTSSDESREGNGGSVHLQTFILKMALEILFRQSVLLRVVLRRTSLASMFWAHCKECIGGRCITKKGNCNSLINNKLKKLFCLRWLHIVDWFRYKFSLFWSSIKG